MEEKKTGLWKALTNKINTFLHNKELKEKLYVIIFESDTPKGKLFDVFLIGFIIMSVLWSLFPTISGWRFRYWNMCSLLFLLSSIWCVFIVRRSRRNIFSAFSVLSICWQPCRCIWDSFSPVHVIYLLSGHSA